MKKAQMIVLGSTLTLLSGLGTLCLFNYKKLNPKNLDVFSIEKASGVEIKIEDKWVQSSLFLCTNKKDNHVIIANRGKKTLAIYDNRIVAIGDINNNTLIISYKNSLNRTEVLQIRFDESDFGKAFAEEITHFMLKGDETNA